CMQQGNFVKAEEWLSYALTKAREIGIPQNIVIAHHALGLTQTYLSKWNESRENLLAALDLWRSLDNHYELADVLQRLGSPEFKNEQYEQAQDYLNQAMEICMELQDVVQRDRLRGLIRNIIDLLPPKSTSARDGAG